MKNYVVPTAVLEQISTADVITLSWSKDNAPFTDDGNVLDDNFWS